MKKLQDVSLLNSMGWRAPTDLKTGLTKTYAWYRENEARLKKEAM